MNQESVARLQIRHFSSKRESKFSSPSTSSQQQNSSKSNTDSSSSKPELFSGELNPRKLLFEVSCLITILLCAYLTHERDEDTIYSYWKVFENKSNKTADHFLEKCYYEFITQEEEDGKHLRISREWSGSSLLFQIYGYFTGGILGWKGWIGKTNIDLVLPSVPHVAPILRALFFGTFLATTINYFIPEILLLVYGRDNFKKAQIKFSSYLQSQVELEKKIAIFNASRQLTSSASPSTQSTPSSASPQESKSRS